MQRGTGVEREMSEDEGEYARWMCGRGSMVNLHRVSAIVRDMRDPCLHHSPSKVVLSSLNYAFV